MLRVNIELGEAPFGGSPVRNIHTLLPPLWPTVPSPLRRSGISALGLIERGAQRRCSRRLGETGQSSQEWLLSSARPRVTVGRILSRLFSITMPPSFDGSGCWLSWQPRFNAKCVVLISADPVLFYFERRGARCPVRTVPQKAASLASSGNCIFEISSREGRGEKKSYGRNFIYTGTFIHMSTRRHGS